jgi:outer membrane receptor for ferric coprogen and ferric-rhodotorulic acid
MFGRFRRLSILIASLGVSVIASAETVTTELDLPAQGLGESLRAIATATHVNVLFDTAEVAALKAPALKGRLGLDEAMSRVLGGTGLTYRFLDEKTVVLVKEGEAIPAPAAHTSAESPMRLAQAAAAGTRDAPAGDSDARLDEVVVIGKGYGVRVGAKSVAPLREVPNTVTVIDQQRIQEQNLFTLEDLALQTTGLNTTGGDSDLAQFVSRGFAIDNFLVDGVPNTGFTGEIPDLFLYDRVEVLRGPAGLFSGSGSPAGSINLVRKRPLAERAASARLSGGSWAHYRGELDFSAPISDRAGMRAGIAYQDRDQFVDVAHQTRIVGFATTDFDMTDATRFTFGVHYDEYDGKLFSGIPGAAGGGLVDLPRSTYAGVDWNESGFSTKAGFAEVRHELGENWVLRASGQYGNFDTQLSSAYTVSFTGLTPTDGSAFLLASALTRDQRYLTADFNAVGSVSLFGRRHEVVVGADYQRRRNDQGFSGRGFLGFFDLYDPQYDVDPVPLPIASINEVSVRQEGVYGQIRLKLAETFTLALGGRVSRYESENTPEFPTPGPGTVSEEKGRVTPYAGIVWDFARDWSFYASFADTFQPQELQTAAGGTLPPVVGEQLEAGVKASLAGDRLLLSAALYRIDQANRAVPDLLPGTYLASGRVQNSGFEIEANGEIRPGWSLNSGYAFIDVEDEAVEGAEVVVPIPEHNVKIWTRYAPVSGRLQRFSIGGGFTWQSETTAFLTFLGGTTGALQPAYSLLDLRLGYEISETISMALNVSNVLDEKYYSRISGTEFGNFYGAPTNVMLTVSARMGAGE